MPNTIHILNGDALLAQFPAEITGEKIILRECLMEGPVESNSLQEFYEMRAGFISNYFEVAEQEAYFQKTVPELEKIRQIEAGSSIYLWFEKDVFCQVNCWFVVHLITQQLPQPAVYLVLPTAASPYSFAQLTTEELVQQYDQALRMDDITTYRQLWPAFLRQDYDLLHQVSNLLPQAFDFVKPVVLALQDRQPKNGNLGRPLQALKAIREELRTDHFPEIFRAFCQREPIYGYGDWQVKAMLKTLTE